MHSTVGFWIRFSLRIKKTGEKHGNVMYGRMDRVQWVIVLAQSSHVDKQVRAVRKNECTHHKPENCGNSGWRRCLQMCVVCSEVLLLQLPHIVCRWSSWRHSSQGARLSIPKKNCKSPKFICITSTSNILNIEVVIKTPMHEQWLHVHQLCSKLESWQLNSNAAPSFIHPAAPHPSAAGKNHLLLLCLAW